jgi:DNA-binding transcriptional LysR family regulator
MARAPNLRQIEAFKAMIESGTVSRAAQLLRVSQPAVSKLIAHLEADTGMELFDRERGRLRPNARGLRLYEEVDRIFAGLQQIERSLETIRREEQERLSVGVIPALSGSFICEVVGRFLRYHTGVHISLHSESSQLISERLSTRQFDVGIVSPRVPNVHLEQESLLEAPLVCIMPMDHHLTTKAQVGLEDLMNEPFIGFDISTYSRRLTDDIFDARGLRPKVVLESRVASDICALVVEGLGVSLLHPLLATSVRGKVAVRRFLPPTSMDFRINWPKEVRNKRLVEAFVQETRRTAAEIARRLVGEM